MSFCEWAMLGPQGFKAINLVQSPTWVFLKFVELCKSCFMCGHIGLANYDDYVISEYGCCQSCWCIEIWD